jgi:hypothetical protein
VLVVLLSHPRPCKFWHTRVGIVLALCFSKHIIASKCKRYCFIEPLAYAFTRLGVIPVINIRALVTLAKFS